MAYTATTTTPGRPQLIRCLLSPATVVLVLAAFLAGSCIPSANEDTLEARLYQAGKNHKALESVLHHYETSGDTLKYRATEFLILHMDAQYTTFSSRDPHTLKALYAMPDQQATNIGGYVDSLKRSAYFRKRHAQPRRKPDLRVIDAEALKKDIDAAFHAWENAPWGGDFDFEVFCNYVLPYKCGVAVFESWRETYAETLHSAVSSVADPDSMMLVVDTLLRTVRRPFRFFFSLGLQGDLRATDLLHLKAGGCYEVAYSINYALRSFAIPTATIYTPRWATHNTSGHAWNGIVLASGEVLPYAIEYDSPYVFDPMLKVFKAGKIYMLPYGKNPKSLASIVAGTPGIEIPSYLGDPRMTDVTANHIRVIDLPVEIRYPHASGQQYLYLCIFGRGTIDAVAWVPVSGRRAVFTDVGMDVVYQPAFYAGGNYHPASDPLIVTYDGDIHVLTPDTSRLENVRLYRKYPMKYTMFRYTEPFLGMKIQISDDSVFSSPQVIHTVNRYPSPVLVDFARERDRWPWEGYQDSMRFDPPVATRYLRFLAAPKRECIIGSIQCYDTAGNLLGGRAYGSKPGAHHVLDGLYGEAYHDPDTAGWVALDFGAEVPVAMIKYLPSHDSNSIQADDRYILYYWDRTWISLGEQVAEKKFLDYKVPANALLWLHNPDHGREERIFTWDAEAQEQTWW